MAIIKTHLNTSDLSILRGWMNQYLVPNYFESIIISSGVINCYDADGHTVLTIGPWSSDNFVKVYYDTENYSYFSNNIGMTSVTYASSCSHGCLLSFGNSGSGHMEILITKTNNNITSIVVSKGSTGLDLNSMYCIAWGDVQPISSLSVTPIKTAQQTQIVPFVSNAPYGTISYTPDAFYIPVGQYYNMGIGQMTLNGNIYLTNGYWAIKDGAVSTS